MAGPWLAGGRVLGRWARDLKGVRDLPETDVKLGAVSSVSLVLLDTTILVDAERSRWDPDRTIDHEDDARHGTDGRGARLVTEPDATRAPEDRPGECLVGAHVERRCARSSRTPGGDAQPIPVRIHEVALAAGESVFIDRDAELLGHGIDVTDVEVDQRVGSRIALVLGKVEPDVPACDRDEERETGLELVLPLLREPQASVPVDRSPCVSDMENRYDLLVHA